MISNELKERILPHLKEVILPNHWYRIPMMFQEVYEISFNDNPDTHIVIHDKLEDAPAVGFSSMTGSFIEPYHWEYAKEHGERL